MLKLDYTARRSDGTTISQLRCLILSEQATIDDLESRIADCRESQADYICRLSQTVYRTLTKFLTSARLFRTPLANHCEVKFPSIPLAAVLLPKLLALRARFLHNWHSS
jgi:hypothetical protein